MRKQSLVLVLAIVVSLVGASLIAWELRGGRGAAAGLSLPGVSEAPRATADPARVARQQREAADRERQAKHRKLTAALDSYAADHPEFAVAVLDNKTGHRYSYKGTKKFDMASIVKVSILAALLLQAQDDGRKLTANERSLAGRMITQSENEAAITLHAAIGKTAGLKAANKRLGLKKTTVNDAWGLTRTTAEDQLRVLSQLINKKSPLNADSRALILKLMSSVVPEQRWGVGAAAKPSENAALKNGWLAWEGTDFQFIINSMGRITGDDVDLSVVVLSHRHPTQAGGEEAVSEIATMVREHLDR